jgi:hypothetical protein
MSYLMWAIPVCTLVLLRSKLPVLMAVHPCSRMLLAHCAACAASLLPRLTVNQLGYQIQCCWAGRLAVEIQR